MIPPILTLMLALALLLNVARSHFGLRDPLLSAVVAFVIVAGWWLQFGAGGFAIR